MKRINRSKLRGQSIFELETLKKFGVERFTPVNEAKKLCPQILLPHVDTIKIQNGVLSKSTMEDKFKYN